MAKLTVIAEGDVAPEGGHPAGTVTVTGDVVARRVSPPEYSTWMVLADLEDGATLRWDASHGDEGVYVVSGSLDVDGRRCPADGAVVVESGAAATATAVGTTRIVHVGPHVHEPPGDGLYGPPQ